jgi:hypothetical protein
VGGGGYGGFWPPHTWHPQPAGTVNSGSGGGGGLGGAGGSGRVYIRFRFQ